MAPTLPTVRRKFDSGPSESTHQASSRENGSLLPAVSVARPPERQHKGNLRIKHMTPKSTIMARLRQERKATGRCYMCGEPASDGMSSCAPCRAVISIKQPWKQAELPYPEEKEFSLTEGPPTDWKELRRRQNGKV
jgi:hypothetical protein